AIGCARGIAQSPRVSLLAIYRKPLTIDEISSCSGRRIACEWSERDERHGRRSCEGSSERMEPRGREQHRWAKPRGRSEREQTSQSVGSKRVSGCDRYRSNSLGCPTPR